MTTRLLIVGALLLGGCGRAESAGMSAAGGSGGDICNGATTDQFLVSPNTLLRGESTDIVVTWRVFGQLNTPVIAQLQRATNNVVELELDLPLAETEPGLYVGRQLNPFGIGASPGVIGVLASESLAGCDSGLTAAGGIVLQ